VIVPQSGLRYRVGIVAEYHLHTRVTVAWDFRAAERAGKAVPIYL